MKKIWKRVCTGLLALTTILTALPTTSAYVAETQYWTESSERVGYIEHVMNDGTIYSTFNEGHMRVEGETAYCVDINTGFKNGYKTRHDASSSMSAAQIEDVALSLEYVKQYRGSHSNLNANQGYLLEQCVVWQRLSEYLGWQCDNVRAAYSEISQDIQNEVYAGARAFVQANKGRYKCGGYIYTGEGQDVTGRMDWERQKKKELEVFIYCNISCSGISKIVSLQKADLYIDIICITQNKIA